MSTQVRKGNKILKVSDDAVDRYLKMGYSVLNASGEVVTQAVPVDVNQLKLGYTKLSDEVIELKDKIKSLEDANAYLTQENSRLTKELSVLKSAPISDKPTTTRRRKQTTSEEEVKE